jgi:outer membrane protein assembly factor BamE (lipoprotein component of BamABCDE complex)
MIRTTSLAVAAAVLLTGCTSLGTRENKGFILDKELVSAIQVGVDNKDSVGKTLGRPSFTGEFDQNEWYYVGRQTTTVAFRLPRVIDQTVLRVRFDAAGNVASIDRTGKEQIASINPYKRETPTLGRRKSFFEDVFGGIGIAGAGTGAGSGGRDQ